MFEQRIKFNFDAAHELAANVTHKSPTSGQGPHRYARVHGHSFTATVILRVEALGESGWVEDFARVRGACDAAKGELDHRLLNEVEGLERPTLERLAEWIFLRLEKDLPAIKRVEVERPTLAEMAAFEPGGAIV
ncbi:MAG: 6-pyruvoyl tetrahydrobiopterin synthase [Alphaproteobacteria bacterium]|nr:6-pyruvoyl tetrahydrobiopterin synthase [Alphaproteobacteria bacterium]